MVYERVKEYCDTHGMTIRQLEIECGFTNGTIGKWKSENRPSLKSLQSVAKATKIPFLKWYGWFNEDNKEKV